MSDKWPKVTIGKILTKSDNWINVEPDKMYKQVTVRLWGKGITLRNEVKGSEIASRRLAINHGEFIVSRIDARNGAFGLIPKSLDGAVVTNDFPVYKLDATSIMPEYLEWLSKTKDFVQLCKVASEGTTNRVRLKENRFLASPIPLPPFSEQKRIVARIEELAGKVEEAKGLKEKAVQGTERVLISKFRAVLRERTKSVRYVPFTDIAKLLRRPVEVKLAEQYREIGVYCFGKGIFHKPPRLGADIGDKDLYEIHSGDFILQITFAWEGAVALADMNDHGLFGSVRYVTFRVNNDICSPLYLLIYMKSPEAIAQLEKISPGSAGRNRVLSVKRLNEVIVPVVPLNEQKWLSQLLQEQMEALKKLQVETQKELNALMPSILDKAFKGEL